MKKLLVVVDVQNDFVDGALGTKEAVAIIPNVVQKIKEWDGDIIATRDTHYNDYLLTNEGRHLPIPHCITGTDGHKINAEVYVALAEAGYEYVDKHTFGSTVLAKDIQRLGYDHVEIIGLCTDICVISNALLIKAFCPEIDIFVDASCCAGSTIENHNQAIETMKKCQIDFVQ